jgi:hypothetical protein
MPNQDPRFMASACMFSQLGPCSTADQISVLGSQDMQEIYSLYLPHAVQACNHSVSLQGNIPREEDEGKLVELGVRSATEGWKFCWLRGRTLQDPCLA